MIRTVIFGANGKMGQLVSKLLENNEEFKVVAGVDQTPEKHVNYFPIYHKPNEYDGEVDIIIDFSHPSFLSSLLDYANEKQSAVVIATTGFNEEELKKIEESSKEIPILYSSNMSLGINILKGILKQYSRLLNEHFDIEIIEKHHNKKLDAPSGTAFLLANTINDTLNHRKKFIFGRNGDQLRDESQIGIHAIRGGTIAGEHSIICAGLDEIIEFNHTALSKEIFALGAIKAAKYIVKQKPGYYSMDDIFHQ